MLVGSQGARVVLPCACPVALPVTLGSNTANFCGWSAAQRNVFNQTASSGRTRSRSDYRLQGAQGARCFHRALGDTAEESARNLTRAAPYRSFMHDVVSRFEGSASEKWYSGTR